MRCKAGMLSQRLLAWNVSTAAYVQSFSVASQETAPQGVFIKSDGLKMYVVGLVGDDVNEYDLSTAWDVSTASYVHNFSVSSRGTTPQGIFFKPDGLKMYVSEEYGNDVNEYNLSTAWNVSTASYLRTFSVAASSQQILVELTRGLFFRHDGLKMYVVGYENTEVKEYNLGTAWNVSTASYVQALSVAAQEPNPEGVFFKPDGFKMYVVGSVGDEVNEYNLSIAWNVSTASFLQTFSVAAQETAAASIFFKPDGLKMYVSGTNGDDVSEYDLG